MKNMKTWLSALLAVMMLLAMTGIAMADTVPTGSITVENLEPGETVTIYQVIEIESDGTAALKDPKWVSGIQAWITANYSEYADAANRRRPEARRCPNRRFTTRCPDSLQASPR